MAILGRERGVKVLTNDEIVQILEFEAKRDKRFLGLIDIVHREDWELLDRCLLSLDPYGPKMEEVIPGKPIAVWNYEVMCGKPGFRNWETLRSTIKKLAKAA